MGCQTLTIILIVFTMFILLAGCVGTPAAQPESSANLSSPADLAYRRGMDEFMAGNFRTAEKTFSASRALYTAVNDTAGAKSARDAGFRSFRSYAEYEFNATTAKASLHSVYPNLTDQEIQTWLDTGAQMIVTENETLYYDVVSNYLSAHPDLRRETEGKQIDMHAITKWAFAENRTDPVGHYQNPVRYEGWEKLAIPHQDLPTTGILRIWFPLPVETESQRNVTVTNLSYPEYIVRGPFTNGDIGYVYYEIPADAIRGDLVLSADVGYTSFEQYFRIDPAKVGSYNSSDPEYRLYTASERNTNITDAVRKKAQEIVGNETNPYLQEQLIYAWMMKTYTYSHVPHFSLEARLPKVAESTYMFETGHGDCGSQSLLFSVLCRSLGIPARATGGLQMLVTSDPTPHFWAQYYVPNYGWVPTDLTLALGGEWFDLQNDKRVQFRDYYGSSLDPARFVVQKRVDVPMDPPFPDEAVIVRETLQYPIIVSDTSAQDMDLISPSHFSVKVSPAKR